MMHTQETKTPCVVVLTQGPILTEINAKIKKISAFLGELTHPDDIAQVNPTLIYSSY
jgi:hypothetical protein